MHKSKKKSTKTTKLPKPIKIKKEKSEEDRTPQPMSHYVDDRLELIKQVFGTLKPKTITNLAPEFLKKKELEEIQEACLNELLGISKKRLLSIIQASKCPTDTETSSDSDVNNIEEHVSLEEISSDSEIESGSKSSKKKTSANGGGTKKNGVKNSTEKDDSSGQISVLELLELQARARAIRSQLALEPVTKIEVNSDNDSDDISSTRSKESRSSSRKERKRRSEEGVKTAKKKNRTNGALKPSLSTDKTLKVIRPPTEPAQKIKLKRNFRSNKENPPTAAEDERKTEAVASTNSVASSSSNIKEEKCSRSASPDVIPIVAEPETLMISDSSDEEGKVKEAKTLPALEQPQKTSDSANSCRESNEPEPTSDSVKEPEDGEILDETLSSEPIEENVQKRSLICVEENAYERQSNKPNDVVEPLTELVQTNATCKESIVPNALDNNDETTEKAKALKHVSDVVQFSTVVSTDTLPSSASKIIGEDDDDDDQNDDVISLGGGDLESEMTEHLEKENSNGESSQSSTTLRNKIKEEDDIISLNSSDDELNNKESAESWSSRWLKSSKVSKVLATSRLGKRVRDKIKKTKRTKKDLMREAAEAETAAEANKNNSSSYISKHEDGSIEQYKELLELRQQRKN